MSVNIYKLLGPDSHASQVIKRIDSNTLNVTFEKLHRVEGISACHS